LGEKTILIDTVDPVEIYGIGDAKLNLLKKFFPKLKIVARGDTMKVIGEDEELLFFEMKLNLMIDHISKFGKLTENDMNRIMNPEGEQVFKGSEEANDALVFGNNGLVVKAKTLNQRRMVESIAKNDIVFAVGPAGTGKTYTAVALAVRALKNREVKKIILTRPAVEAGENLGFLPGDLKEKLDPYMQPLYDALFDMVPAEKLASYIESRVIQIAPLAFMRGRTLDNAFVILDEAQNATESQLKMFLTRMGPSAKFIITGDVTQIDLPRNQPSGLIQAMRLFKNAEGIDIIMLDEHDVIRHSLVKRIINIYNTEEPKK